MLRKFFFVRLALGLMFLGLIAPVAAHNQNTNPESNIWLGQVRDYFLVEEVTLSGPELTLEDDGMTVTLRTGKETMDKLEGNCPMFYLPDTNIYPFGYEVRDWRGAALPTGEFHRICGGAFVFDGSIPDSRVEFEDLVYSWCVSEDCYDHRLRFTGFGPDYGQVKYYTYDDTCPTFLLPDENANFYPFRFMYNKVDSVAGRLPYTVVCDLEVAFNVTDPEI